MLHSSLKAIHVSAYWSNGLFITSSPISYYPQGHLHTVVGREDEIKHLEDVNRVLALIEIHKVDFGDDKRSLREKNEYSKQPTNEDNH